ncbi:MAG: outer membrane beta-barrel protein [Deltaproteobacteria bacterium]|jgi:hypothetical protein|nr:outer membrane beta-barrel protein [Deltaproteobacteria bacterium]
MLPFVLPSLITAAVVLSSAGSARADVVVVPRNGDSDQVVVKTKPPTVVVVKQKPANPPPPPPKERDRKLGLHFDVGGTFGPQVSMGGFTGALRFRPTKHVGIDLGSGYFAGHDYQGSYRTEVPLTANVLFFLNPQHKFQFYFLLGPGVSFGRVDAIDGVRRVTHIGGQGGFGVELRLAPVFALNTDVRGVVRHRVDGDPRPEFFDGARSTDTSAGAIVTFGGTFYF